MFGFFKKPSDPPPEERPFQAVVPERSPAPEGAPQTAEALMGDAEWSVDEIEAAYLRALEAAESVDGLTVPAEPEDFAEAGAGGEWLPPDTTGLAEEAGVDIAEAEPEPADEGTPRQDAPRVTPRQIVEALLFVGGRPLTSRQVADVLGGSHTPDRVDDLVSDLNSEYTRQQRPYEVRLGEGGYRLHVTTPYEKVRARVFGIGPREVKLAQNALEVLALVAYQQPVSRAEVEETGIKGAAGLLRQLLRRQLIELHRGEGSAADTYRTTDRFLELFGLRSLKDLPRPEAVNLR